MATTAANIPRTGHRSASRSFFAEQHAGTAALFGLLVLVLVGTVRGCLAGTGLAGLLSPRPVRRAGSVRIRAAAPRTIVSSPWGNAS
jgi:hypothetical protein